MKVTVLQDNLARGLSTVSRAVSPRSTLPVLSNVLIASDEGRLRLSATNLELGITCWIGAKIEEEGSTTVPARTFSDLVSTLPQEQVSLNLNAATQTLNVRCGTSEHRHQVHRRPGVPAPARPGHGRRHPAQRGRFQGHDLAGGLRRLGDEARPVLMGVLVVVDKDCHHHGLRRRFPPVGAQGHPLPARRRNPSPPSSRPAL